MPLLARLQVGGCVCVCVCVRACLRACVRVYLYACVCAFDSSCLCLHVSLYLLHTFTDRGACVIAVTHRVHSALDADHVSDG